MSTSLLVEYFPEQQAGRFVGNDYVLAVLRFGQGSNKVVHETGEVLLGLREIDAEPVIEVWSGTTPVEAFQSNGISCRSNGDYLFGALHFEEQPGKPFEQLGVQAYEQIFVLLGELRDYHLVRAWNYFPRINEHSDGVERYQSFCVGRYRAFDTCNPEPGAPPAATAIGSQGEGFIVYFLASRIAGVEIDNPRQVSAFHYPSVYSPKPPMFSRAMWLGDEGEGRLFVSGTASVKGHETRYQDDIRQQVNESFKNLRSLLDNAGRDSLRDLSDPRLLKVYLRNAEDYPLANSLVQRHVGDVPCVFLQADICRRNLLVEIDALI